MVARQNRKRSYDAQMLHVAGELFNEFPTVPVLTVIRAFAEARNAMRGGSSDLARPSALAATARQELRNGMASSIGELS